MPYDIVDAYEDIAAINHRLNLLIQKLVEFKVLPEEKLNDTKENAERHI